MSKLLALITMSVDGYITGPDDGPGAAWALAASDCTAGSSGARGTTTPSSAVRCCRMIRPGSTGPRRRWGR